MKRFKTKLVVLALSLTIAAPLMEACVVSVPFFNFIVGGDEDEIEDILDELEDD